MRGRVGPQTGLQLGIDLGHPRKQFGIEGLAFRAELQHGLAPVPRRRRPQHQSLAHQRADRL